MARHLRLLLLTALVLCIASVDAKPFFDAIYDAINGNGRRSYGYSGYGNSDYGYGSYGYRGHAPRHAAPAEREGRSWKSLCRAHYPDSISNPGAGGVVCPY